MSELEIAVKRVKPAVFGVSEANLHYTTDLSLVQLPGYTLITSNTLKNPKIQMSRVVVYLSEGMSGTVREDLMSDDFSSIWVELSVPGRAKKLLVSNIYRDHQWMRQGLDKSSKSDYAVMARWQTYLRQWKSALETEAEVHCLGDFNLDSTRLLNSTGHQKPLVQALLQQVVPLGVTQCAPAATWIPQGGQRGQPSGLDHHWTNRPDKISEVQALAIGNSDHKLISAVRYAKVVQIGQQYVNKRSYKKFDKRIFLDQVKKIQWWPVYRCVNVDEAVEVFTKSLTSILDRPEMAPVKRFQSRRHYASWLSDETKTLMITRDEAMKKYNRTLLPEDWEAARSIRNHVTRLLKSEKCRDVRKRIKNCEEEQDSGRVWKNIRSYLGWGGNSGAPTRLTDAAGQLITSPAGMSELQNSYYIKKVEKIREQLPRQGDPTARLRKFLEARPQPSPPGLTLTCVTPQNIDKIIRNLKNSKACGLDNIDTYIMKLARPYIVPAVTHIVNQSITTLTFPKAYKVAKVVPLYKGKDSPVTAPKSYRPVALLPITSKVLKRVVHTQLMSYMDQHQLWHPQHHAYRSHHSTTTAMLSMHDCWVEAAENGKIAGMTMVDMSAAFDVVDIQLLLKKCCIFNFSREAEQWMWSYLTDRSQCTSISGSTSSVLPLVAGVPQGSILGPALYTLFTCDFPEVVHEADCPHSPHNRPQEEPAFYRTMCTECGGLLCYADDSTYTVTANSEAELSTKMSSKFQTMSQYLKDNRLCINTDKTHIMVMCTEQRQRHIDTTAVSLNTGSEVISPTPVEFLLGVQVDQNLGFGTNLFNGKSSVISSLNVRIGALKRISKISSFKTRLSVCSSLVISKILYVLPLYGGAPEYMMTALQQKMTAALRIVTKKKWDVRGRRLTSTAELLTQCGLLSVKQMVFYHSVAAVHKVLKHRAPEYLHQVVTNALSSGVRHRYPTSTAGTRAVTPARLSVANTSFRWRASTQYAALPQDLQLERSLPKFLTALREHTRRHVPI